jgi:pyruvate kinase
MTSLPRKTKILCTIGPATSGVENLVRLIYSGMDAARLNFSHGSHEVHAQVIRDIREAGKISKRHIPILLDLQGPKIRTDLVENGEVMLEDGQEFRITVDPIAIGNNKIVYTPYKNLIREVSPRNTILVDDGYIILVVEYVEGREIVTKVVKGGKLKNKKGIIVPGVFLSAPSISEKDIEDLRFGLEQGVDAVALSFVRSARDILELKAAMKIFGREVPIVAKIERLEAVEDIDEIIEECTGIMVARGDLGLEMPAEKLPLTQKHIIDRCNHFGKPVITATQMLESMITNPRPTRAEASDVANAVLDGSDVVMLSGETSVGAYPFEAAGYMSRIIQDIETKYNFNNNKYQGSDDSEHLNDAIAKAACLVAERINAAAIVTLSDSTQAAKNIAAFRPKVPIVALSEQEEIARRLSFIWGVVPFLVDHPINSFSDLEEQIHTLEVLDFVKAGDFTVVVSIEEENSKTISGINIVRV